MTLCKRCLYPNSKPDLLFDGEGICSACRAYERRPSVDWAARRGELEALLKSARNGSGYDCIIPSSGGKDSTYQAITVIEMGFRPLIVTASTCHLTPIGRANIDNLARYATTVEVTPNREVRAKLNRLGLQLVGDISLPEHWAIFSIPFQMACRYGIPLIVYGENPQSQYGGPPGTDEAREMTLRWAQEFGGYNGLRPSDMAGKDSIGDADMRDYMPPSQAQMKLVGVHAHFLGQYIPWDSHRNAEVSRAHGMRQELPTPANWWDSENLDCTFTAFHDHAMHAKYGYGRCVAQLSVDIRAGRISREGALQIAMERDGKLYDTYAGVNIWDALALVGVTKEQYFSVVERFASSSCLRAA